MQKVARINEETYRFVTLISDKVIIENKKKMSSEREQNGPTQVHPQINYNDLPTHIQMNGINGIGMMGKSFGKCSL